jgi:hypothetical protein
MQTGSFPFTNGFVLILGTETLPEEGAAPKPVVKPPQPKKIASKPAPKPAALPKKSAPAIPRFTFEAEREWLHSVGSGSNSGDMNVLNAAVNIRLRRNLALSLGAHSSSYGLGIEEQGVKTFLRSFSAAASAGIILLLGRHTAAATAFGGYAMINRDISQDSGPYAGSETTHGYEIGGTLRYSYGHTLETAVTMSNSPFCPLSAKIGVELPLSYRIWTEADVLWFHTANPLVEEGLIGGITLRENTVYARLMAGFPLWRIGNLLPSVLVAGTINASETGSHHENLAFGGELSFEKGRLLLRARVGAFIFGKAPFVQVGISH